MYMYLFTVLIKGHSKYFLYYKFKKKPNCFRFHLKKKTIGKSRVLGTVRHSQFRQTDTFEKLLFLKNSRGVKKQNSKLQAKVFRVNFFCSFSLCPLHFDCPAAMGEPSIAI